MHNLDIHHIYQFGIITVMIGAIFTLLSKKINRPYPIVLVIVGAVIGLIKIPSLEPLIHIATNSNFFYFVIVSLFLPTLIGEASLKLPFHHLNENRKPILLLAILGTILSFLIVGLSAYYFLHLPLQESFTFAALMSATDPVSVISIFKSLGVNKRLSTIIEGESLFNDGIAVVLFNISAFKLVAYMELGVKGIGFGLWDFVYVIAGGILIGTAFGVVFSFVISWIDDYPIEIIFSIITFYGSFLVGEHFHVSGVIAVVVAGLIFGNFGAKIGMSPTTKTSIDSFWDTLALLANSLVFLMIGLEIAAIDWNDKWILAVCSVFIVIIARSIAIYLSLIGAKEVPSKWKHVLNWGGLKGSLSIALALSLPADFPGRETILVLTFSVVFTSLLLQGLSIAPLLKWLGLKENENMNKEYEEVLIGIYRNKAALKHIEEMKKSASFSSFVLQEKEREYKRTLTESESELLNLYQKYPELENRQKTLIQEQIHFAEYQAVEKLTSDHHLSDEISSKAKEDIMDLIESNKQKE